MRITIATAVLALLPALALAQDPPNAYDRDTPRFGVGLELLRPVLRITNAMNDVGGELLFTYRTTDKRSWRFGYAFSKEEDFSGYFWSIRDSVMRSSFNGRYGRIHQVSIGHQWGLGKGRLRPFVGTDAYIGYLEEDYFSSTQLYSLDSLQGGGDFGMPIAREGNGHYLEGLRFGLGGALGMEYSPHRHFSVQLRISRAYFVTVPLDSSPALLGSRRRGLEIPDVGAGVFVQFKF